MARNVNEVVDELRAAHAAGRSQAALAGLLADKFEMRHHPAVPSDGIMEASVVGPAMANDQLLQAAPGLRRELTSAKVDGDRVELATRIVGALPDGVRVDVPFRIVLTVAEGKIVRLDSHPDEEASKVLAAFAMAQAAAGQQAPA